MSKQNKLKTSDGPAPNGEPLRLEWRDPSELAENPANWRLHPPEQIAALSGVIAEAEGLTVEQAGVARGG